MKWPDADDPSAFMVPCPECCAEPGEVCVTGKVRPRPMPYRFHLRRLGAVRRETIRRERAGQGRLF